METLWNIEHLFIVQQEMRTAKILQFLLAFVLLVSCGGRPVSTAGAPEDEKASPTATAAKGSSLSPSRPSASPTSENPTSPKPAATNAVPPAPAERPPPAHIETKTGITQMAQSSYCWGGSCADYVSPESRDDLPSVPADLGETVTFHLGFQPKSVDLHFARGGTVHLEASKDPTWTVDRIGVFSIFATVEKGDSSYAARLLSS